MVSAPQSESSRPQPRMPQRHPQRPPRDHQSSPRDPQIPSNNRIPTIVSTLFPILFPREALPPAVAPRGGQPSRCCQPLFQSTHIASTHIAKWYTYAMYICLYMSQPPHDQTPNNPATRHLGPKKNYVWGLALGSFSVTTNGALYKGPAT